jgi:hypothetical protein
MTLARIICFALTFSAGSGVAQQPTLAIDASRPFVYVQFDHSGPRKPSTGGESNRGLWLKLVNNSTLPIQVRNFDLGTGDTAVGVMFEVAHVNGRIRPGHKASPEPHGYSFDVASLDTIKPGGSLTFSVPAECVSEDWYIRVPFEFELPPVKHGYEPTSYADFTAADITPSHASTQPTPAQERKD